MHAHGLKTTYHYLKVPTVPQSSLIPETVYNVVPALRPQPTAGSIKASPSKMGYSATGQSTPKAVLEALEETKRPSSRPFQKKRERKRPQVPVYHADNSKDAAGSSSGNEQAQTKNFVLVVLASEGTSVTAEE